MISLSVADRTISDRELLIFTTVSCLVIYYSLSIVYGSSQVPVLVSVFIFSNMISRTSIFQSLVQRAGPKFSKLIYGISERAGPHKDRFSSSVSTNVKGREKFESLSQTSKLELLTAIKSLESYAINTKKTNDRRRKLFKLMSWRQQKLCEDVGYLSKLKRIDNAIHINQVFLKDVAQYSFEKNGLSFQDFELLKDNESPSQISSTNYRVIESLGHYLRDWSPEGESEITPVWDYVRKQLDLKIPPHERPKTCVIVPGSGLGRIAHEIANHGDPTEKFAAVHAVEYSGLMHVCNNFIYAASDDLENSKPYELYPHIHSCSNFYDTASQFKPTTIEPHTTKPLNLHLNHDDFRYFSLPNREKYEYIVVVSIFFMDTAENLVDYMDAVHDLATPTKKSNLKNGYWINIGPLKYGSAAQVELNADEFAMLRKNMGWRDSSHVKSIQKPDEFGNIGLVGYITHKESMWQGYYGLNMWTSARKENQRRI
ncbi:putative trehalase N2227-like protein [Scheffersomyces xylosifermentans]|uniref:putative trehalase N2227-like protein n=1 Tax=Scheffersomyces xylosifermentans TaxID=1304137 RepID=UPI00315CF58F